MVGIFAENESFYKNERGEKWVFFVFFFILSKLALPGVTLKYERGQ